MQRLHPMPFGATVLDNGDVRFRLWAPAARTVELAIDRGDGMVLEPMAAIGGGWYERVARPGTGSTHYRYRIDGHLDVPDPASRFNPQDVRGPSRVVDPRAYDWQDEGWSGRPWDEAVIYELHVGTFTTEGTFAAVIPRLDYLVELGVTAIELMPVADFPGRRGWGYDGVLHFAPESAYGTPEDLKRLVGEAHRLGLMVLLDVVYNHFGPEGNFLHAYAPPFFTDRYHTPWGKAIDFSHPLVRAYFIHNALYWLEEFHFDGLRLDAVHAIRDESPKHFVTELAERVAEGPGRLRHVHLVLENDHNSARFLRSDAAGRPCCTAQWNDDFHHAAHVAATGESDGYYTDYADAAWALGRCLAEGFAYQGEPSRFRDGEPRGEPSADLPPGAFVNFLQNHDQVGNRAFGERLARLSDPTRLAALEAILLLAPSPPLLFMGEEMGARTPFLYFCDFEGELAAAVRDGRRREFSRFARFSDSSAREAIPDPGAEETFLRSKIDWASLDEPSHAAMLARHREMLALRASRIVPLVTRLDGRRSWHVRGNHAIEVRWGVTGGTTLVLLANLGDTPAHFEVSPASELLYCSRGDVAVAGGLPPWTTAWLLEGH